MRPCQLKTSSGTVSARGTSEKMSFIMNWEKWQTAGTSKRRNTTCTSLTRLGEALGGHSGSGLILFLSNLKSDSSRNLGQCMFPGICCLTSWVRPLQSLAHLDQPHLSQALPFSQITARGIWLISSSQTFVCFLALSFMLVSPSIFWTPFLPGQGPLEVQIFWEFTLGLLPWVVHNLALLHCAMEISPHD